MYRIESNNVKSDVSMNNYIGWNKIFIIKYIEIVLALLRY